MKAVVKNSHKNPLISAPLKGGQAPHLLSPLGSGNPSSTLQLCSSTLLREEGLLLAKEVVEGSKNSMAYTLHPKHYNRQQNGPSFGERWNMTRLESIPAWKQDNTMQ